MKPQDQTVTMFFPTTFYILLFHPRLLSYRSTEPYISLLIHSSFQRTNALMRT